jgi:hypothetical protein
MCSLLPDLPGTGSWSGLCAALSHPWLRVFSSHRSLGNLAVNLALVEAVPAYLPRKPVGAAVLHLDQGR